jgi:hypothetical protein
MSEKGVVWWLLTGSRLDLFWERLVIGEVIGGE